MKFSAFYLSKFLFLFLQERNLQLQEQSSQQASISNPGNPGNDIRNEINLKLVEGSSNQLDNTSSASNPSNHSTDKVGERNLQLLEGASSQLVNTSNTSSTNNTDNSKTCTEKPLLTVKNHISIEHSFNNLNNSMFHHLNVVGHSSDHCNSCSNHEHCQGHPKPKITNNDNFVDVSEILRRKAETKAAITSPITNLVLGLSIILILIHVILTSLLRASENSTFILIMLVKGMIPIVTGIANFVKVQEVLVAYWHQFNPFSF